MELNVVKCPKPELTLHNRLILSGVPPQLSDLNAAEVEVGGRKFIFGLIRDSGVKPGDIGFTSSQRNWAQVVIGKPIRLYPVPGQLQSQLCDLVEFEIDLLMKGSSVAQPLDTDLLKMELLEAAMGPDRKNLPLSAGQSFVMKTETKSAGKVHLNLTVTKIEIFTSDGKSRGDQFGFFCDRSTVIFKPAGGSTLRLTGKAVDSSAMRFTSIISPDWDFTKMGIGGLDKEFSAIFRRAFASRVFPPQLIEQLGLKHARGILLYGPPGTGKTLIARQIGKMLHAREPKIVNGPSILDKYVGESEANVRKLFEDAEKENKQAGMHSALHIIIFDEIDAICKSRGSTGAGAAVHDTVVNQLLSKLDGVDQLNNILVIGMTNRRDMIDEALLRPGRMEVQMEIGLPDEHGRVQILKIHTSQMRESNKLNEDVNLEQLATQTKNFSGAEIEGLCRAAASSALNEKIKFGEKIDLDVNAIETLKVSMRHFEHALENDIKPAFGTQEEMLEQYVEHGIVIWDPVIQEILDVGNRIVTATKNDTSPSSRFTVLLHGPCNSGKTALAVRMARNSGFPFIKFCSAANMVGFTENAKCHAINKVFLDAYKSQLSCIILDNIEGLIDYSPVGPRYSNMITQALISLITRPVPKGKRLLIIGTTSDRQALVELRLGQRFTSTQEYVPNLNTAKHICATLSQLEGFSPEEIDAIKTAVDHMMDRKKDVGRYFQFSIGIKQLIDIYRTVNQMPSGKVGALLARLEADVDMMGDRF